MAAVLQPIIHFIQFAFSTYSLYLASVSIRNLQGYEEKSEKAAEWSDTAAQQLHKTRSTQASGAVTIFLTCISSIALVFYHSRTVRILAAAVNFIALLWARKHVGSFWKGKTKLPLPGVGDYNDAITITEKLRLNMLYLAGSWAVVCLVALVL